MPNRRVVITGTGLITALGTGVEKNWRAKLAGTSGVGPITRFDATGIEPGDRAHAGRAGEHGLPVLLHAGAQRGDEPGSSDDDAAVRHGQQT